MNNLSINYKPISFKSTALKGRRNFNVKSMSESLIDFINAVKNNVTESGYFAPLNRKIKDGAALGVSQAPKDFFSDKTRSLNLIVSQGKNKFESSLMVGSKEDILKKLRSETFISEVEKEISKMLNRIKK